MSSSVMTPRRQSSASPPLIGARVSTFQLQALEANTELNKTHLPHPIDYQLSVNGRRRTRFTLHRLLSVAILTAFAASKFIDSFHGRALTLGLLDLIAAIPVFILIVLSWFESDTPPYLGWLFDTDWDYLLDITMRGVRDLARRVKRRPSVSLGIFFGAFSALFAITRAIFLSPKHHPRGYFSFLLDCLCGLGYITFPASLMVVGGDQHQRNAYKYAFFMSAILTQLATLASWTMDLWFPDRPGVSLNLLWSGFCLWCITLALGYSAGHLGKLKQTAICELNNFVALEIDTPHIPLQSL
ncbi:hypothetical protein L210DRAFT_3557887 [Boletus edulis BED1]|uniref:Uncharacterized protein n=1 Tax=Boletus edulis BED1 TaxID=1328754 RepID=A0AAD4BKM4_BOLED|nr:hypothetical protein L210DRAFT_3557887 [Boletus edulis BED1]